MAKCYQCGNGFGFSGEISQEEFKKIKEDLV
jgi:hypothetical protein